jgi:hypothetical protein
VRVKYTSKFRITGFGCGALERLAPGVHTVITTDQRRM